MEMARDSLERLGVAASLTPVNPVELLGELVDQAAAIVAFLREQVEALPSVLTDVGQELGAPLSRLDVAVEPVAPEIEGPQQVAHAVRAGAGGPDAARLRPRGPCPPARLGLQLLDVLIRTRPPMRSTLSWAGPARPKNDRLTPRASAVSFGLRGQVAAFVAGSSSRGSRRPLRTLLYAVAIGAVASLAAPV
jgi:hypothetical protein